MSDKTISPSIDELAEEIRLFKRDLVNAIRRVFTAEQAAERAEQFDRSDALRSTRRELEDALLGLRAAELNLPGLGDRITTATQEIRAQRTALKEETERLKRTGQALNAAANILQIVLSVITLLG